MEIRRGALRHYRRRKVSDKIGVLEKLIDKWITYCRRRHGLHFLEIGGYGIGKSLCEPDMLDLARNITKRPDRKMCSFYCR